jgi:O-acetyl-ADP-ribose deacetylase (regulator of RNase III)
VDPRSASPAPAARLFGSGRIELVRGDITRQDVDAVVNAANSSLLGGGGVDGAIHRAGGPAILEECRRIRDARGPLPPGEAVATSAGRLPCRHVIHTVGPVWNGGGSGEREVLAAAYRNGIALAAGIGARSLALPSVSTGAYGYPLEEAARVALGAGREALRAGSPLMLLRWVLFSDHDLAVYREALDALPA